MSRSEIPTLVTAVDLARAFDVSEATLRRIMRQRDIRPTAMAGHVGVYDSAGVARVRHAVNAFLAAKGEKGGDHAND